MRTKGNKLPKRGNIFNVRAYLFQCKNLPAEDDDGLSDPFLTFWEHAEDYPKTKVIENTVNPVFYEVLDMTTCVFLDKHDQGDPEKIIENMRPFMLDVFD